MSSDDVTSPAPLPSPPSPKQRYATPLLFVVLVVVVVVVYFMLCRLVQSSEVLNDIDQMLANLNLEIDNLMTDP